MPTYQKSFDSINDILREGNKVFVVPVFQRPYAWEDRHIQTLIDDIDTASQRKPKPFHYFSPIHVIEVEDSDQIEWKDYVDHRNEDIMVLDESGFQTDNGSVLKVYLVIDGQKHVIKMNLKSEDKVKLSKPRVSILQSLMGDAIDNPEYFYSILDVPKSPKSKLYAVQSQDIEKELVSLLHGEASSFMTMYKSLGE